MLTHISKIADDLIERVTAARMLLDDLPEHIDYALCEERLHAARSGRPTSTLFADVDAEAQLWAECAFDLELRSYAGAILREMGRREIRPVALERLLIVIWNKLPADRRADFIIKVAA